MSGHSAIVPTTNPGRVTTRESHRTPVRTGSARRWKEFVRRRAPREGEIIGVDDDTYPMDVGSSIRYELAFAHIPEREELPEPLTVADIDRFIVPAGRQGRTYFGVDWH